MLVINVSTSLLIPALSDYNSFTISPNPFTSTLEITFQLDSEVNSIVIIDNVEDIVDKIKVNSNSGTRKIDMSGYALGVYYCRLLSDQKVLLSEKILIKL